MSNYIHVLFLFIIIMYYLIISAETFINQISDNSAEIYYSVTGIISPSKNITNDEKIELFNKILSFVYTSINGVYKVYIFNSSNGKLKETKWYVNLTDIDNNKHNSQSKLQLYTGLNLKPFFNKIPDINIPGIKNIDIAVKPIYNKPIVISDNFIKFILQDHCIFNFVDDFGYKLNNNVINKEYIYRFGKYNDDIVLLYNNPLVNNNFTFAIYTQDREETNKIKLDTKYSFNSFNTNTGSIRLCFNDDDCHPYIINFNIF